MQGWPHDLRFGDKKWGPKGSGSNIEDNNPAHQSQVIVFYVKSNPVVVPLQCNLGKSNQSSMVITWFTLQFG